MNWNDLRFVLAVAQARSFFGAGKLLRVTHSTVSRRITALERAFGTPLFSRENNLCVPAPFGARLIIAATRIEEEIRAAQKRAGEPPELLSGPVHISTVHWIINEVLLPAAPQLRQDFPGILLRFYGGLYDGPREGAGSLLSLRFELKQGRGEEVIPIADIGYAVYAPADCADPERLPWVSFGGSLPYQWLEQRGVRPEEVLVTAGDATGVIAAIESGIGKGLVPECLGGRNPKLRRLSGPKPEFSRVLRIVGEWHEISAPRCQAVINWMEKAFKDLGCGFAKERGLSERNGDAGAGSRQEKSGRAARRRAARR